ncbi:MAG: PaaI family thioesterase [Alphaproteobacteria bacterium]|nr:PaaI family thioesterase [Alphaproteobacteria bacterium]
MTDTLPLTVAALQAKIDASPFNAGMGITVTHADAEAEEIAMRLEMRPEFERAHGTGQYHGGVISAFIDTVGDYALVVNRGGGVPTINYRTDFLRPASNTALTGKAKVRRAGRTVAVVDIDVYDEQGRLVAVGRGTYGTQVG